MTIELSNNELREAVKLWLNNESKAITKYGHISLWDTSKVNFGYSTLKFYNHFCYKIDYLFF